MVTAEAPEGVVKTGHGETESMLDPWDFEFFFLKPVSRGIYPMSFSLCLFWLP